MEFANRNIEKALCLECAIFLTRFSRRKSILPLNEHEWENLSLSSSNKISSQSNLSKNSIKMMNGFEKAIPMGDIFYEILSLVMHLISSLYTASAIFNGRSQNAFASKLCQGTVSK